MTDQHVALTVGDGLTVAVNDISLYYEDQGSGDAIVLLHGGLVDHEYWGSQIAELAKHHRVLSPDTRGHGRSTDSDKPLSYAQFADDTVAFLREIGIARANFVGHSDGGCTSLVIGAQHPELVEKLVLIGTPYNISNYHEGTAELFATMTPEQMYEMVGGVESPDGEVIKRAQDFYPTDEAWRTFWKKLVNDLWSAEPDFTLDDLAAIQAPTLILHAENEEFYDIEHSEAMARAIPNATLEVVPGATHGSPQENPAAVNAAILAFLDRP